ncbi:hypothetical protein MIND_00852700 [Mycena indigotica]|uniref:Uncharacterized protein n=1 Tax=Mycena indigotica TaxID=2126181 RepID=A0A8H6SGN4_9AGAR|nr:uncharacterized protein MIND_00852700 [Mycena indigotica]KAF7299044.1 hypothetical protein MIND_00852700 [Mycena indigotica]
MPRRPRKTVAASKPRPVDRNESKVKKWNKASDIPLDDEDQFHAARDKILLDGDIEDEDLEGDEEEVFGLGIDDDDDDESMGEEEETPEAASALSTTKSKSKKSKKKKKELSSEDSEEEGWGRGRSAYYSSNAAQLDSDDEQANELEEQEAIRLQAKARDAMQDFDFGLDDVVEPMAVYVLLSSTAFNDLICLTSDAVQEDPAPLVEPQDTRSLIRSLEKNSPETLALARDWEDTAESLTKTRQKIASQVILTSGLSIHVFAFFTSAVETLLSYATALAFYLHLRSSSKYARRPELLRNHPIMSRLLTLKQALITLEDLDFAASDSDLDDEESDEGDLLDANELWKLDRMKGLDEGELEGLLDDADVDQEELDAPRPKKRRKTAEKTKNPAPLPIFDLVEPEFTTSTVEHKPQFNDDGYGEATFLQHADVADKQARRKSLRFHTSKIESASARRQGARNQAIGGDDDIPYREARKQLNKHSKSMQKGQDLDDSEPPSKQIEVEEETQDAEGYYELIKRTSKEKKARKKAEYEAAQAAARYACFTSETDGPRSLTRAILMNKGLTPRRPKSVRNPRVKKREKFKKANMKVASQKAVFKGGLASTGRYDGERSGISKVVKSVLPLSPPSFYCISMDQLFPAFTAAASFIYCLGHYTVAILRGTGPTRKDFKTRHPRDGFAWLQIATCAALATAQLTLLLRQPTLENGLLLATYSYVTLLVLLSDRGTQLQIILTVAFGSVAYRDLFPLTTYTLIPKDASEGWIIWTKAAFLFMTAIVIPLFRPRLYTPVDAHNPMEEPNAEQTSSWFSSLTYFYLEPLIFRAFKHSGLSVDQFPPLADSDAAAYLTAKNLSIMDPQSPTASKSLLRGIFKVFRSLYVTLLTLSFVIHTLQFAEPLVMNKLLRSLETEQPFFKPWVWVILLFAAPTSRSLTQARYTYHSTRQRVQLEAILVQLLFRHSLRLRLTPSRSEKTDSHNLIGRMNNLVTSDLTILSGSLEFWINFVVFPFQIALGMSFLYSIVGWSALVGLAVIVLTLPVPYWLGRLLRKYQIISRKKTDQRVQNVTETVSVLRMIKSFALERHVQTKISAARAQELSAIWVVRLLTFLTKTTNFIIPLLIMLGTFSTYTLVMKQKLTASVVFTALTILDGILRPSIARAVDNIPNITEAKVSLDRIDEFLRTTEMLDSPMADASTTQQSSKIGIQDTEFSWSVSAGADEFRLRVKAPILFMPGVINIILGPTGVGKTAMLLALLGEMHVTHTTSHSWVNLPREEGIAYAAQQPWIENATFKQNIVLDYRAPFDEERYRKVLHACALYPDLKTFAAGDETEIGEKGLSLSGGQRARTHHVNLVRPICGHVVSIHNDGSISQGSIDKVSVSEGVLEVETTLEQSNPEPIKAVTTDISRGKLIVEEKAQQGMVKWSTYKLFFANLSAHPVLFMGSICVLLALNETMTAFQAWFLGYWSRQYVDKPASSVDVPYYLGVYTGSVCIAMVLYIMALVLYASGTLRAIRIIHEKLMAAIVGTTLRWLDTTPMSRVLARATQDTNKVDGSFANGAIASLERTISILAKFVAVMIISPTFLLPGAMIIAASAFAGWVYLSAQLPIQREVSRARSPMLAHFSAAVAGLPSIRAYQVQGLFLEESARRVDLLTRPAISYWNLNRWITVRSDSLGAVYSAALGWYLLLGPGSGQDAANVGFSLSMAMSMTRMILWWVRITNAAQLDANNLERIEEYIEIEQEPRPTKDATPPAYWPASGQLIVQNVSARYSADEPNVLHNINLKIKSGERIGIVGRTGSGKSSLTLALLRFIPTEGEIIYDNIPIHKINLDSLRSNITIIPQVPELLAGTIRANLDPFGEREDSTLNDALRGAGLFSLRIDGHSSGLTLDSVVAREGSNMSLGERQIVAMARAIVRRSPLVILDEATSAIDFETDALIQRTLRNEFKGTTIITVAHRLQTVMDYDRIIVLDAGRLAEFGSPEELILQEKGLFRSMVEDSIDRDDLVALANRGGMWT